MDKLIFSYRLPLFLIFLLVFSLFFSKNLNGFFIILISSIWLIGGNYKEKWQQIKKSKMLVLVIFYLSNIIGILYSANLDAGLGIVVKRASLLLLPLVLVYFIKNETVIRKIKIAYILACFLAVTYSLGAIGYWFATKNEAFLSEFNRYYIYSYYRQVLCIALGIHPTYFSIFLLFGVFLILEQLITFIQGRRFFWVITCILVSIYMVLFSIFLASRMPLIAFFFVFFLALVAWIQMKKYYVFFVVLMVLLGIGCYKAYHHPILSQRFREVKDTPWQPPQGIHYNSTNIRIGILTCTFSEIKNHLLFGTGTGDMQDVLNTCYASKGYSDVLYKERYNTHNVFLDAQLMLGFLGLGALLLLLSWGFRVAFLSQNYIYVIFLLFWSICGMTEALLNTQKGIVFFAVINTLLYLSSIYRLSAVEGKISLQKEPVSSS